MNWAASHLANKKELYWTVEKKGFLKAKKGGKREIIHKEFMVSGKVALLRGKEGAYLTDYLTSADYA